MDAAGAPVGAVEAGPSAPPRVRLDSTDNLM